MKALALVLIGSIGLPLFATSPIHPYAFSMNEMTAVLSDMKVQKKLYTYYQGITGIVRDNKLKGGTEGYVVSTEKCDLEVAVSYKPGATPPHPGFPGGRPMERVITVQDCR